jgi:HlyD family secretion protein
VGEPCLEVTDLADLEARAEVDELESSRVRVGQAMTFRMEALPEIEWKGTVEALWPNVYRQSPRNPLKVIGIKVSLEKPDSQRMRPGMQFRGRLLTDTVKNVLLVPIESVFTRGDGTIVYRKTATGFERVRVELGRRSRKQVEVKSGLKEGDRVSRRELEGAQA